MSKHKCISVRSTEGKGTQCFLLIVEFFRISCCELQPKIRTCFGKAELRDFSSHRSDSEILDFELFTHWIEGQLEVVDDCPWETLRKVIGKSSTWV